MGFRNKAPEIVQPIAHRGEFRLPIDHLDRRILAELQRDGSQSNAELAERVGSTGPSCWRRIRLLEEAGVLTKNVWLVDPVRVG